MHEKTDYRRRFQVNVPISVTTHICKSTANMFLLTLGSDVPFSSPGSGAGLEYSPDKRPYPSFALL